MNQNVRVGVGVIVVNSEGKVLIGKRKGSHGAGKYGYPGGHQEFGETIQQTALRELKEESNLDAQENDIIEILFTDDIMLDEGKHYVTFFPVIKKYAGNLENLEPDKMESWNWLSWDEIKELGDELFTPPKNILEKYPHFDPANI